MIMLLPRRLTSLKPCCSKIRQASLPDRTRSLPNRYFQLGHIYLGEKPCPNLLGAGGLEEKIQGLQKVAPGLFHIVTLAGYIQLGTQSHETISFPFDQCRTMVYLRYVFYLFPDVSVFFIAFLAAASITGTGAVLPVHISKEAAPWYTSIWIPPKTPAPA